MLPHTAGAKVRRANPVSVWLKSAQSENKEWMIEKPQNSESLSCLPLKKSRDAAPSAHRKGIQAHSGRTPGEEKRSFWFGSLSLWWWPDMWWSYQDTAETTVLQSRRRTGLLHQSHMDRTELHPSFPAAKSKRCQPLNAIKTKALLRK